MNTAGSGKLRDTLNAGFNILAVSDHQISQLIYDDNDLNHRFQG